MRNLYVQFCRTTLTILCLACFAEMIQPARSQNHVCIVTGDAGNPYYAKILDGAKVAANRLGLDLHESSSNSFGNPSHEITAVEQCTADHAVGILITADDAALSPSLKAARAAGIIVVALDHPAINQEDYDAAVLPDYLKAGWLLGNFAKNMSNATSQSSGALNIVIGNNFDQSYWERQVLGGFFAGNGGVPQCVDCVPNVSGCDNCTCKTGDSCTATCEQCKKKNLFFASRDIPNSLTNSISGQNGDDVTVFSTNTSDASASLQVFRSINIGAKIVSLGGACDDLKQLKSGGVSAIAYSNPAEMSKRAIEIVSAFARHGTKPENSVEYIATKIINSDEVASSSGLIEDFNSSCW